MFKLYAVFAFYNELAMEEFKVNKDIELAADRKLASMDLLDTYSVKDVVVLFEEDEEKPVYPYYLIYEIIDPIDAIKFGISTPLGCAS